MTKPHVVDSGASVLQSTVSEGICRLTLSRPERGNALSDDLVEALLLAVDRACADKEIHTLVLDAQGKHFCTGFDLSGLDTQSDGDLLQRFVRVEVLLSAIWHAPLRTVAVAQGRTWGAGADLVAVCDDRLATTDASFRFPGAAFGLVLGTRRLADRLGVDWARRCVIEGLTLDAETALRQGLATQVLASRDEAEQRIGTAPVVARDTLGQLFRATRADHRDADLATLVRSASKPGLKQRIIDYRDRVVKAR